jgi:hyperosmotically inducible protein
MRCTATLLGLCLLGAVGCEEPTAPPVNQGAQRTPAPDNTGTNVRDRSDSLKTPINQNENQADIDITAGIRKRVVDSPMSTNAHNIKIITQDRKVTLRGPVNSDDEKKQIEAIARDVAGASNVDSQLEITP